MMLPAYQDIRSRIVEPPVWHDRHGVPRYEPFQPSMLGVYDDFAILAEIACQCCGARFLVGAGWTRLDVFASSMVQRSLEALAESFDYGDPPRHDAASMCGCAGETMRSETIRVVEGWERIGFDWVRREVGEASSPDGSERVCVSCEATFRVSAGGLYWHNDAGGPLCGACESRWAG